MSLLSVFGINCASSGFKVKPGKDKASNIKIFNRSDTDLISKKRMKLLLETGVDVELISYHETGSSYTCDPPVTTTDEDYIILVDDVEKTCNELSMKGFQHCSRYPNLKHKFVAMRYQKINFIITYDEVYYLRYVSATEMSKKMNLLEKEDRINLFHAILDEDHYYRSRSLPIV